MSHYHEVYFNEHTGDGPRVGATRRTKKAVKEARQYTGFVWPGAAIVRCDRPDNRCPWTVEGVPGEESGRAQS